MIKHEQSVPLVLTLDCNTGDSPWTDPSVPMVDEAQRLDVRHCKNAGVGTYISAVQGGDVPIQENDSGRVTIRILAPEGHVANFDIGDELDLMKGPYLLAKCRLREVEEPEKKTTEHS